MRLVQNKAKLKSAVETIEVAGGDLKSSEADQLLLAELLKRIAEQKISADLECMVEVEVRKQLKQSQQPDRIIAFSKNASLKSLQVESTATKIESIRKTNELLKERLEAFEQLSLEAPQGIIIHDSDHDPSRSPLILKPPSLREGGWPATQEGA